MTAESAGTAQYFPSLLSKIHDAHPDIPVDNVILQAILLCIVAGRPHIPPRDEAPELQIIGTCRSKHLLLRTREEDVNMVVNIVATILTTIFGFPTHKSRIKPSATTGPGAHAHSSRFTSSRRRTNQTSPSTHTVPEHPEQFLRSLFFRPQRHSRVESILSNETRRDRKNSSSRKSMSTRHQPRRSSTFPLEKSFNNPETEGGLGITLPAQAPSIVNHAKDQTDESFDEVASLASSRRPLLPNGANGTPTSTVRTASIRPQAHRLSTEPTPLLSIFQSPPSANAAPSTIGHASSSSIGGGSGILPKALVVSGLENTEVPCQRALMQVLVERRLVLDQGDDDLGEVWNLPDDFICVYVCPSDPSDRPPVLLGLLDKFSMSVDVPISPSLRQVYTAYRGRNSPTPRTSSLHSPSPRSPTSPLKPLTPSSEPTLPLSNARTNFFRPASAPPPVNKSPIITHSEIARLRALTNSAPLKSQHNGPDGEWMKRQEAYTSIHPSLNMYLADLFSATRHHPEFDSALLTLRAHKDAEDFVRAWRVINGPTLGTELISSVSPTAFHGDGNARSRDEMNQSTTGTGTEADTGSSKVLSKVDDESLGWGKMEDGDEVLMSLHGPQNGGNGHELAVRVQAPDTSSQQAAPFVVGDLGLEIPEIRLPDPPPEIWDVSEVDIARVFPRVVSHRLKVREGPDDEILGSLMFPAAEEPKRKGVAQESGGTWHRRTVKEILVEILADV